MTKSVLVFGYGSLMNPRSLALTLPGERTVTPAVLQGYRRVCNVAVRGYAYLNLEASTGARVEGVLVQVWQDELPTLFKREEGYEFVNITSAIEGVSSEAFAFIARLNCREDLAVPRSYLQTCFGKMEPKESEQAFLELRMPGGVYEDLDNPVYQNYVLN